MPTIAPRMPYQPNAPQQLPQLQERPDLSGAQTLQTIGETIANLGQLGADYLKMRKAASTAAATEAAAKWEQDQLLNKGKYEQSAVGVKIPTARDDYFKKLDGDTSKYEADLGEDARAEFQKRIQFKRQSFKNAGDLYAKDQSDKYIVSTSKADLELATKDLSMGYAAGMDVTEPLARISQAAESLSTILGIDAKKLTSDMMSSARYGGLAQIKSTGGTDEQIVKYYEANKGTFGANEGAAAEVAAKSNINISANWPTAAIVTAATDEYGNFSLEVASGVVLEGLDPAVREEVDRRLQNIAAADAKQREEIGKSVVEEYTQAQINQTVDVLESSPEFKKAYGRMAREYRIALEERKQLGPKRSNPAHILALKTAANAGSADPRSAWFDNVDPATLALSHSDLIWLDEERSRRRASDPDKIIKDTAYNIWTEGGMRRLPGFGRGETELDGAAKKEMDDYNEFVSSLIDDVKTKQLDGKDIKSVQDAARALKRTFDEAAGGVFSGSVAKTPKYRASTMGWAPPTPDELKAAKVPASAGKDEAALMVQAWRISKNRQTMAQSPGVTNFERQEAIRENTFFWLDPALISPGSYGP